MTDIPIIFGAPMIQALLAGRKLMTRRMLYSERKYRSGRVPGHEGMTFLEGFPPPTRFDMGKAWVLTGWHKATVGDRLWCRENTVKGTNRAGELIAAAYDADLDGSRYWSACDWAEAEGRGYPQECRDISSAGGDCCVSTKARLCVTPCIHMPRKFSRLTLILTATKIEPLQQISNEDAIAEGIMGETGESGRGWSADGDSWFATPAAAFKALWISLHGRDGWESNPFVVCLSFHVVKANIDSEDAKAAA
jgi:hypothetical protein